MMSSKENLYNSAHKSTNPTYRENYEKIFRKKDNPDCPAPEEEGTRKADQGEKAGA
jgi:hypothetical protein